MLEWVEPHDKRISSMTECVASMIEVLNPILQRVKKEPL